MSSLFKQIEQKNPFYIQHVLHLTVTLGVKAACDIIFFTTGHPQFSSTAFHLTSCPLKNMILSTQL